MSEAIAAEFAEFQKWREFVKGTDVISANGHAQISTSAAIAAPAAPLRLDLGCGTPVRRNGSGLTKDKGWTGVDVVGTEGADVACDLGADRWPWPDASVDEAICNHTLEHIPAKEVDFQLVNGAIKKIVTHPRVHFMNELWRVLKPGAKAQFTTPHWCSCRAYGDVTHEWPPVSEMFWQYLNKEWRALNAPHTGYICDFELPAAYGYVFPAWLQAEIANRNGEFVQKAIDTAISRYKEAAQDMQCTLVKRG